MKYQINYQGFILGINVHNYSLGTPPVVRGDPDDCYEGDPRELDYEVEYVEIDDGPMVTDFFNNGEVADWDYIEDLVWDELEDSIY